MKLQGTSWKSLPATIILANIFWFATFYLTFGIFWVKITISAFTLAVLSIWIKPIDRNRFHIDAKALIFGFASAVALYLIFWAGKEISSSIFPFAEHQIGNIYGKGEGFSMEIVFLLLFFITGPCEELYWRGFVQDRLMESFGGWGGWLLSTAVYAGVHIWSFNFMLVGASAVAGAFWGLMYRRSCNLFPVIISHSIWSAFIFAVIPLAP